MMAGTGPGQLRQQPVRVIVANDTTVEAVAALSDLGKYVAVDVQSFNSVAEAAANRDDDDDDDDDGTGVRLYQSIYETALRNKVPVTIIEDMIRIYSYDVDFQRKAQADDSFEVFFAGEDETPANSRRPKYCMPRSRSAAKPRNTIVSRPPTIRWSITMTRPERARRNFWYASRSTTQSCAPASAVAAIRFSATPRCTPAWTGRPPTASDFRFGQRRDRKSRLGRRLRNTSASSIPTATKPPTAT